MEGNKSSGGLPEVRRQNRAHIREVIYRRAPVTRTEIASELGLTLPTVTTSVAKMLEDGLLLESPSPDSVGSAGGRPPLLLRFNPKAGYAIGVELGPYETAILLSDLEGTIVSKKVLPTAPADYEEMLCQLETELTPLLQNNPMGIGLGLPGFIRQDSGEIRTSVLDRRWNDRPIAADLSRRLGVPVIADNNVRMRARGQALFHGKETQDLFAYLFVSKGIACPLMIRGHVLSGSTSGAGELGHMVMQPGGPICPTCGKRGCLESLTGETAILRDCTEQLQYGHAGILAKICGENPPDIRAVLQAQQAGDTDIADVMENALRYLGLALANVVNLISPAQVLVEGYIFRYQPNQELLLKYARSHFFGLNAQEVQIRFLDFDRYGGALGAASAVIERFCIQGEN